MFDNQNWIILVVVLVIALIIGLVLIGFVFNDTDSETSETATLAKQGDPSNGVMLFAVEESQSILTG